jgi:hypothetical protein
MAKMYKDSPKFPVITCAGLPLCRIGKRIGNPVQLLQSVQQFQSGTAIAVTSKVCVARLSDGSMSRGKLKKGF